MLVGGHSFIKRARKIRKMLGGGMRQAGIIAAAGIVALDKMIDRLSDDHTNARYIAEKLAQIKGIEIDLNTVQTNMIYCNITKLKVSVNDFVALLKKRGILVSPVTPNKIRLVTNRHVSEKDARRAIEIIWKAVEEDLSIL